MEAGTFPVWHTVASSVCRLGTVEAGMGPVSHTVGPSVCRLGTVPGVPPAGPGEATQRPHSGQPTTKILAKNRGLSENRLIHI